MEIVPGLVDFVLITGVVLLWARWAKLDLGLRVPSLTRAWPWILLYIAWYGVESAISATYLTDVDPEWLKQMEQRSFAGTIVIIVVMLPVWEELLFRGAMFSAIMRRWGVGAAVIAPSLLWSLFHVQYEWWVVASIAGSGMVLAVIRWKSGSLWPSLILHASGNLLATLYAFA